MGLKNIGIRELFALVALLALSCSSLGFNYRFYVLDAEPESDLRRVTLRGPEPEDDLPGQVCEDDQSSMAKCIVYLRSEHEKLQRDFLELQERLIACEEN
jgi:hypothetical protein